MLGLNIGVAFRPMVTQLHTFLVDDIDGSEGDVSTIQIALDKVNYEIDLSPASEARLREKLDRFVAVATPVKPQVPGARRGRKSAATARTRPDKEQTLAMRKWARDNGYEVSNRGRIPKKIQEAFEATP